MLQGKRNLALTTPAKLGICMKTAVLTPPEIRKRIWTELGRATQDRHHAWRTPALATIGQDGIPNARTVVLRETDTSLAQLRFFTDGRSLKVAELAAQPCALVVFWSKRLSWQLRVRVVISTHVTGPVVETVWDRVRQSAAAGDYLSACAPGTALVAPKPANLLNEHHLVVMTAQVQDIDWLELGKGGHRRARFSNETWEWLTP